MGTRSINSLIPFLILYTEINCKKITIIGYFYIGAILLGQSPT